LWLDLLSVWVDREAISVIVDLGCGTGRFAMSLGAGAVPLVAIDSLKEIRSRTALKSG
jgi:predicted RNA methylase